MELDWLRDFGALAEYRSFSRAAELRHVSQPAFSRRIRALEEWVGVPLFERRAQGAVLTPAGVAFRPQAEELMRGLHRARREALAAGGRAATLSIAATHALSFTFFPAWMRRHLHLEALGAVNLVSDSMEACEALMLAGEVQLLLCHHHPAVPDRLDAARFESVVVGEDVLVAASAPDGAGRALWPLGKGARRLDYSAASGLGRILAVLGVMGGGEAVFSSHHAATLMTMAREGHGVAWLPLSLAGEDLSGGRLVRAGGGASEVPMEVPMEVPVEVRLYRARGSGAGPLGALWAGLGEGRS